MHTEGGAESPTSGSDASERASNATVFLAFSTADILPVGKGYGSQHTSRDYPLHQHSSSLCTAESVAISFPAGAPTSAHVTLQMMPPSLSLSLSLSLLPRTHAVGRMELSRTTAEQPWRGPFDSWIFHTVEIGVDCSNWSFIVHRIPLQWALSNTEEEGEEEEFHPGGNYSPTPIQANSHTSAIKIGWHP